MVKRPIFVVAALLAAVVLGLSIGRFSAALILGAQRCPEACQEMH